MATINGTAVNFGFASLGLETIGGFVGTLVQRVQESVGSERELIRNYIGDRVADVHYDQVYSVELEVIVSSTGIAAAKSATVLTGVLPGTFLTITSCAEMPDLTGTTWEVVGKPRIEGTNTTAKRVMIPIERCAGITAVATS